MNEYKKEEGDEGKQDGKGKKNYGSIISFRSTAGDVTSDVILSFDGSIKIKKKKTETAGPPKKIKSFIE